MTHRIDPKIQPTGKRQHFECPHCSHMLPVDGRTECSRCGAHLELRVKTIAEPRLENHNE